MLNRRDLQLASLLSFALAGCRHDDPYFCEDSPHHNCLAIPDAVDAPMICRSDEDCTAMPGMGVCDPVEAKGCVQCTVSKHDACTDTSPVCSATHTCQACTAHTDCPDSLACLPTGACGTDSNVAYVDPAGMESSSTCTRAAPCVRVSKALDTKRAYIKFHGQTKETDQVSISDQDVTLLADPGAQLTRMNNGLILEIKGASHVTIYDLEVTGASSNTGVGISLPPGNTATLELRRATVSNNTGGGISATGGTVTVSQQSTISGNTGGGISATGGTVTVSQQSTISGNTGGGISATGGTVTVSQQSTISDNPGGGIVTRSAALTLSQSTVSLNLGGGVSVDGLNATFDITNMFIFRNGDQNGSTYGGVNLNFAAAGSNRLAFNTIVDNAASVNSAGVICSAPTFQAPNNIIARNSLAGSPAGPNAQKSGACSYPTSLIQADVAEIAFVDPDAPAPFVYKLKPTSTAIDRATTSVSVTVDNEGDARPLGVEKDIGADEYKPTP